MAPTLSTQVLGQSLAPEEVGGVPLLERPEALVWVPRLQAVGNEEGRRAKGPPEREILGQVLVLGPDSDHVDRVAQAFQSHRAALDVLDAFDLARQVRDLSARQHFARAGEAAEPGSQVERTAAVSVADSNRLAGVETDPDREREGRIGDCLGHELLLQVGRDSNRLARGIEDG